jgi:uncharacterized LabA/DUF88 family protein
VPIGSDETGGIKQRGFLVALKHMGFDRVVTRPPYQRYNGASKSPLDTVLTMDVSCAASEDRFDCLILVSGDSDFVPLVERIVDQGKQVIVVGPNGSTAWELIVAASRFIDANSIEGLISRSSGEERALDRAA